jgi:tetratricopeptide (TPR) repeat protein
VYTRGVAAYPSNAILRRNLAITHSNVADVLVALKRPGEALDRQRTALATFEELASADPANAAAKNDVAISVSKIAEMLDASERSADAVREYRRALEIHLALVEADPASDAMKLEVASDYNRLATAQARIGARQASLESHTQAVTMVRELQARNPGNVELKVALGLALAGRADAHAAFARRRPAPPTRAADLAAAERDYAESVALFTALKEAGAIQGTDLETLEANRRSLEVVRGERGG